MLFHFFFLSSADGDGQISFQQEGVFFHGFDVVHVYHEPVVAFKEAGVFRQAGGELLKGVGGIDGFIHEVDGRVSSFAAVHVKNAAEGDAEGFAPRNLGGKHAGFREPFGRAWSRARKSSFLWLTTGFRM